MIRKSGLLFWFGVVFFIFCISGIAVTSVSAQVGVDEPFVWFGYSLENGEYAIGFYGENIARYVHAKVYINGEKIGRAYPVRTAPRKRYSGEYALVDIGWLQGKVLVPEPGSYEITLKFFEKKTFLFSRSELITIPYPEEPKYGIGFDSMALDNFNALAGTVVALPPIKLNSEGGDGVLQELVLQNKLTARMQDLGPIILYKDPDQVEEVGVSTINPDGTVAWKNLDFDFSGTVYVYPFVTVRGINYSEFPDQFGTATAGRQFQFSIQKAVAMNPYSEEESYMRVKTEAKTPIYDLVGAKPVTVFTNFPDQVLQNGVKQIFNLSVTAGDSGNVDYDGSPLAVKPCLVNFFFDGASLNPGVGNVVLADFYIQRKGSPEKYSLLDVNGNPVELMPGPEGYIVKASLNMTFGESKDGLVFPGETADYILSGNISDVDYGEFIHVSIKNLNQSFSFQHNTGMSGIDGPDTRSFYLNIPGLEVIEGGTLY